MCKERGEVCEVKKDFMKEGEPSTRENKTGNLEELLEQYASLVKNIADNLIKTLPPNIKLKDLIDEGTAGLYDAITKYDPSRNTLLKTYAEYRIKGAMLDFVRSLDLLPYQRRRKEKLDKIEPIKFTNLEEITEKELFEELHSTEKYDPFTNVSLKERAEKVSRAIETLPPHEKEVINLICFKGLTKVDIGKKLGKTEGTINFIYRNALKKLHKKLKNIDK